MRKNGYSIREISKVLGIAKSTSSLWTQGIHLSIDAQARLLYGQNKRRRKGISVQQYKLAVVYNSIQNIVEDDVKSYNSSLIFERLLCSFLYWSEGAKTGRQVRMINSDPILIQTFLKLLRNSFKLYESKFGATLHLHEYHNKNKQLQFWSKITKIPKNRIGIYLKPHTGIRKKVNYPGCIAIHYYDAKLFDILTAYYRIFANRLGA